MFNALSTTIYSWETALLAGWALALLVAVVIVLGFIGLKRVGITFSEQARVRVAGAGYWGTLACAVFCLIVRSSSLVPAPMQPRQPQVQAPPPVPGLPSPVTLKDSHFVPAGR